MGRPGVFLTSFALYVERGDVINLISQKRFSVSAGAEFTFLDRQTVCSFCKRGAKQNVRGEERLSFPEERKKSNPNSWRHYRLLNVLEYSDCRFPHKNRRNVKRSGKSWAWPLHCWSGGWSLTTAGFSVTNRCTQSHARDVTWAILTVKCLGKVIQMNKLDATMIYWSIRSAQHVSGNILPITRSVKLRFLQHMVSCCCGGQGDGEQQRGT